MAQIGKVVSSPVLRPPAAAVTVSRARSMRQSLTASEAAKLTRALFAAMLFVSRPRPTVG
jgi:hypothetical protein